MARKNKTDSGDETPAWVITLTDLMTLMMAFFILLVSVSAIDERSRLAAVESVSSTFGSGPFRPDPVFFTNTHTARQSRIQEPDMTPIRDMLREEMQRGVDFREARHVQILSIDADILYDPGGTELSERGKRLLNRMVPTLLAIRYPLLVAGHTAAARSGTEKARASRNTVKPDSSWETSLTETLGVYRHLLREGLSPERLSQEAFGEYSPRYSSDVPESRQRNRRVDIVLDKRNAPEILAREGARQSPSYAPQGFFFRNFRFDVDAAPETAPHGRSR